MIPIAINLCGFWKLGIGFGLGCFGFGLAFFGFAFEVSAKVYIDIIPYYKRTYVHSDVREIGFALHKKVNLIDFVCC